MTKQEILAELTFGHRVAEEEGDALQRYFVETDHWRRLYRGDIDIVYGPKGAGKSALYSLLNSKRDELFDRSILLVAAENPRGTTAFRGLVADPPASEAEFRALWKTYFACLIAGLFKDFDIDGEHARKLRNALECEGLVPRDRNLRAILRAALDYVRGMGRPESISALVEVDATGLPTGIGGRITFAEPSTSDQQQGFISIDTLLYHADQALEQAGYTLWLLLDRLDVAFAESQELEHNALRALFHVYRDLSGLDNVKPKIFLRTDIWRRITEAGFREASHITRSTTITWDRQSHLNLIVRRAVQNAAVQKYFAVDVDGVLSSILSQESLFSRIFPDQVDIGPNKPKTLDWMIGRTRDATGVAAPREMIHLLNALREVQIRKLEVGDTEPDEEQLFSRASFKEALVEVSRVRLEQTLYAEYPSLKERIEALRGEKTSQNPNSLAKIWQLSEPEAISLATEIAEVGFFEVRGAKDRPEYWVPFLYRDSLDLVQGSAD